MKVKSNFASSGYVIVDIPYPELVREGGGVNSDEM